MWTKQIPVSTQGNPPILMGSFPIEVNAYFKVSGPGNVFIGTNRDELASNVFNGNGVNSGPPPGLPQSQADKEMRRPWKGDIWAVADAPETFLTVVAPAYDASLVRASGLATGIGNLADLVI